MIHKKQHPISEITLHFHTKFPILSRNPLPISAEPSLAPAIALFWDLENIPPPTQTGERLMVALQQFIEKNAIQYAFVVYRPAKTSERVIQLLQDKAPGLQSVTIDSDMPNAVDRRLLEHAFQTIASNSEICTVYLVSGDHHFHSFLAILKKAHVESVVICRNTAYSSQLAQKSQKIRYIDALIKYPTCWWYPLNHPKSIAYKMNLIQGQTRQLTQFAHRCLSRAVEKEDVLELVPYLNQKEPAIRMKVFQILKEILRKYSSPRKRKQIFRCIEPIITEDLLQEILIPYPELGDYFQQMKERKNPE